MTSTIDPATVASPDPLNPRAAWKLWGRRGVAFLLDISVVTSLQSVLDNALIRPIAPGAISLLKGIIPFAYWTLSEALLPGNATPFKWLFRLRLVRMDGTRPRVPQILVRAAVIAGVFGIDWAQVMALLTAGRTPLGLVTLAQGMQVGFVAHTILVSILSRTAPLLHDLLSGTRVVARTELPAALPERLDRVGPRLAAGVIVLCAAIGLIVGTWGEDGPDVRRLWAAPEKREDYARVMEGWIANRLNLRCTASISAETRWGTGQPSTRVLLLTVELPWGARSPEITEQRVAAVLLDSLRVDPAVWKQFELRVRSEQSGLLQLNREMTLAFDFDSTAKRWRRVTPTTQPVQ